MDVALGPSGGEILAAECAAPRASGVYPRPALQADSICGSPLTPFLHRLGIPASVHRDVKLVLSDVVLLAADHIGVAVPGSPAGDGAADGGAADPGMKEEDGQVQLPAV